MKKTGDKRTRTRKPPHAEQAHTELNALKKAHGMPGVTPHIQRELDQLAVFRKMFSVRVHELRDLASYNDEDDRLTLQIVMRKRMIEYANVDEISREVASAVCRFMIDVFVVQQKQGPVNRQTRRPA